VLAAELLHDGRVSVDDERHIVAALSACGVAAQAKVIPPRRDAQTLTWLLLISVPLQGFLSAVGEKVAADAYSRFTHAVERLLGRHHRSGSEPANTGPPVLVLQDPATGLRIILEAGLPPEAQEELCALDLSRYRFGPLHYDRAQRRWRSELDEADTRHHE
jgi:hypothetical protein